MYKLYCFTFISILVISINALCELKKFVHKNFVGDAYVHNDFVNYLNQLGDLASGCGAKVYVTDTYNEPMLRPKRDNTSLTPVSDISNHHIGHAIDFNLGPANSNKIECKKECLSSSLLPKYAECFTQGISKIGLRWGKFDNPSVADHIDLEIENFEKFRNIYNSLKMC